MCTTDVSDLADLKGDTPPPPPSGLSMVLTGPGGGGGGVGEPLSCKLQFRVGDETLPAIIVTYSIHQDVLSAFHFDAPLSAHYDSLLRRY